ncbi:MAG: endolytic transglycosylase MltG [Patescibacteria group bacterium]|nr:endolytic transglycosylase MltG [Patescibacteria group bacterium]
MEELFKVELEPKKFKKPRTSLISILILVLIIAGILFYRQIYLPSQSETEKETVFKIEEGQGLSDISSNLEKAGIIKSKILFVLAANLKGVQDSLQAGTYNFSSSMSISEILNKLSSGDIIKEKITIPEGWNLKEIGWYFEEKGVFKIEELFEITGRPATVGSLKKDFSDEFDFLKEKPENIGLEGYLFPDTYEIKKGESLEELIRKMLKNFDKKVTPDLREEISKQGKTLFDVLIMASLLEKEVKSYEDKQIAAGILWKRLKAGWPLQVDATLTYLTGKPSSQITKSDKEIDSSYNTYKYLGLPLGPISNPGLEGLKAAIYYQESPYWFYLTSREGETIFSKTLREHAIAREKYLK